MPVKTADAQHVGAELPASSASLFISRNKHWRYISFFHGPWLQLPIDTLQSLAHQNYVMPPPRTIDPAVFYDMVKIRQAVDDAAHDSVRASSGVSTQSGSSRHDAFGMSVGPTTQLSKERLLKIRQKAVRSLYKAYSLDEIAASVATMQSTCTIEDVAKHVLRRDANNCEGRYVDFFHEKVPSRKMEQYTTLHPLDNIIVALPAEQRVPPLRTRAMVQLFKGQWAGAVDDLTIALRIVAELKSIHSPNQQQIELAYRMRDGREKSNRNQRDWKSVPLLKEEAQPSGVEQQLLFHRATAFLSMACESINDALDGLTEYVPSQQSEAAADELSQAHAARLQARKKVKISAKKAQKDYVAFLSFLGYTPGLSPETTREIARQVSKMSCNVGEDATPPPPNETDMAIFTEQCTKGARYSNRVDMGAIAKHTKRGSSAAECNATMWPQLPQTRLYPASALFAEQPLADISASSSWDVVQNSDRMIREACGGGERISYHPFLSEALHGMLLAYTLMQTSATELRRHAQNVARLVRIADGHPLFQAARSPAEADWVEILRRTNNWVKLPEAWRSMCAPAIVSRDACGRPSIKSTGEALYEPRRKAETLEQKHARIKRESILEALSDDRVVDEESFQQAVRAREQRFLDDEQTDPSQSTGHDMKCTTADSSPSTKRFMVADGAEPEALEVGQSEHRKHAKHCPIASTRAVAIARWVQEAPLSVGPRRKRPSRKKRPPNPTGDGHDDGPD